MSLHHQGIYIRLLAAAWCSDEPGTLLLPLEIAARSAGLDIRSLRDFMAKSPRCFVEIGSKLVNEKLHQNWINYQEISEKRRKAAESRYTANALQMHQSASASALASAPKNKEPKYIAPTKRFIPPTEPEIILYMTEQQIIDPVNRAHDFIAYYETRGWIPGGQRTQMKSWKAAVRTWKNRDKQNGNGNGHSTKYQNWDEQASLKHLMELKLEED